MMKRLSYLLLLPLLLLTGCAWDDLGDENSGYPAEIGEILIHRCATSGCHTSTSAEAAAGLNLETWQSLYHGSNGGSAVIPYSPDQSYLLFATNTDSSNGDPVLKPTMPIGGLQLSTDEYARLRNWILEGGSNAKGEERFPPVSSRRKWYVINQGCDVVAVMDAESRQIMKYVRVGQSTANESPHYIRVSKDGLHWYVVFLRINPYIEIYSTLTDEKVGQIQIGNGSWNTMNFSADGKFAVAVSYVLPDSSGTSQMVLVNLQTEAVTPVNFGPKVHGSAAHPMMRRFYITEQEGDGLWYLDYDSTGAIQGYDHIDLVRGVPPHNGAARLGPHEVYFIPDGSKYFVTCQYANEVRIYRTSDDQLLSVINVGNQPVEFGIAPSKHLIFVTVMEDQTTFGADRRKVGSVAIIDYNTNTLVKSLYTGYQPHGIVVDEQSNMAIVAHRNISTDGPAPHHSSNCGGRNGYLRGIDLNTLELVPDFKTEMVTDPYSIAVKH
ncbi:MAG: hypothetical protein U0176_21615 [Bacteroidia bacterium]